MDSGRLARGGSGALFLDRDGVINVDHGYVFRIPEFEWIPGIFATVATARELGLKVIVATNQSGIGRGYYSEEQFAQVTEWMRAEFERQGAPLDAVYHCPFHPEGFGRYRADSPCRKPQPGMLLAAARDLDLDLSHSVLLGDRESDAEAAQSAGLKACALLRGPSKEPLPTNTVIVSTHSGAQAWLRSLYCV